MNTAEIVKKQRHITDEFDAMSFDEQLSLFAYIAGQLARRYPDKFIEIAEALPEAFPDPWLDKEEAEAKAKS